MREILSMVHKSKAMLEYFTTGKENITEKQLRRVLLIRLLPNLLWI